MTEIEGPDVTCDHEAVKVARICTHLHAQARPYRERFSGRGTESALVCDSCAALAAESVALVEVCAACRASATEDGWVGIVGAPGITEVASRLAFEHTVVAAPDRRFIALAPITGTDRACWVGLDDERGLYHWDLDRGTTRFLARVPDEAVDPAAPAIVKLSSDGALAAVANRRGERGAIIDLATGRVAVPLVRDGYQAEHCDFPLAFFARDGCELVVHAPEWNRLDVMDARTGELLTTRARAVPTEHPLDYFHCGLAISPDRSWIVDNGWIWHPVGGVIAWSLERWLAENPWESEDGPTRRALCHRDYFWDGPLCWIDDHRVAVYGYGEDDEWLIPAARIFDVRTGEARWFPGPRGAFTFDRVLIASDAEAGTSVWDVERGARLHVDPVAVGDYHPSAKLFVARTAQGELIASRLRGHDADAPWNRGHVRELVASLTRDVTVDDLAVLGDALEVAGCTDGAMLAHCRQPGEHGARCWVIDRLARS